MVVVTKVTEVGRLKVPTTSTSWDRKEEESQEERNGRISVGVRIEVHSLLHINVYHCDFGEGWGG